MAATGKSHPRWGRYWVNGYELSGDTMGIGELGVVYQTSSVTGWRDRAYNVTLAHPELKFRGLQGVFNNNNDFSTSEGGVFVALQSQSEAIVTYILGVRDYIDEGDTAFLATFENPLFTLSGVDGILFNANFEQSTSRISKNPWGKALARRISGAISSTTVFDVVDFLAGSSVGAVAHLHVYAGISAIFNFTIHQSATGLYAGEETVFATFTANGSTRTAEVVDITGTVQRYQRLTATRTGGVVAIAVALAMK